jgi:site-specific DNA-adenine methylase
MPITSLINYIGHKSKIQEKILHHLPAEVTGTFYDCFAGSAVIALNAPYANIECRELNPYLSELYTAIQHQDFLSRLEGLIDQYGLTNSSRRPRREYLQDPNIGTCTWNGETIPNLHLDNLNRQGYDEILSDFNSGKFSGIERSAAYMIAAIYGRNSNVAYDPKTGLLSGTVGPLDFSPRCRTKLADHVSVLRENRHRFVAGRYQDIQANADDFCYFDPPYLASSFKYSGWTDNDERELLKFIDALPCDWAISNTLQSGSRVNAILSEWAQDKIVIPIDKAYRKWAGGGQSTVAKSVKINREVLILSRDFLVDKYMTSQQSLTSDLTVCQQGKINAKQRTTLQKHTIP